MSEKYEEKERKRMEMVSAIQEYKDASEAYGDDEVDRVEEIETAIFEAGLRDVVVRIFA